MPNVETILRYHVTLKIECIDRLYLNGYLPRLQTEGAIVGFLLRGPEHRIPSPALLGQMTQRFVESIERFAEQKRRDLLLGNADEDSQGLESARARARRTRTGDPEPGSGAGRDGDRAGAAVL